MSDTPSEPLLQSDEGPPPDQQPITPIIAQEERASQILAVEDARAGDVIPLSVVEEYYKRPGGTLFASLFGSDPLDFWIGRFYVGFFGIVSMIGATLGTFFYLYQVIVNEHTLNLLQGRIDPPRLSAGLSLVGPGQPGHYWQLIVISATIAFFGWLMRQVDICRKLRMSYEVPIAYGAALSSWVTLQWLRPLAMGAWGNGFPLGITHHLDWVSNIGYQYHNFFYNPFHAIGVSLLFGSTLLLAMHGSAILSANRPAVTVRNIDTFWRGIVGYSIGEIGIHRIAFWTGAASVLFSNLCIFLSGTLVQSWTRFWSFWPQLPIWSFGAAGFVLLGGVVVTRQRRRYEVVDIEAVELGGSGIEGYLGRPRELAWANRLFGSGQFGPIYLGIWGVISLACFCTTVLIILNTYLYRVGYNPILFLREFPSMAVDPPAASVGLSTAPWYQGGDWLAATFFLHACVLTWWARIYARARQTGLGTHLAWGFSAALFLYFTIYLIRPLLLHSWNLAPGHGLKAILDWTNNTSVLYGNFYYNPFHMISIFFLLGSTLLLAMHGATIVATSPYGSELELKEMEIEGPGTHRAQLFWRWTMGFNANAVTIHYWCWWFAALCGISGAIGLLLSGTVVHDWFQWAQSVHIVAPPDPNADWSQFIQMPH